ncbi:MAG: hypothetical protein LKI92_04895 [Schleiferilactobacillus harbinensis]|jgi:membrane-bound ClpP family serine protease|nr:hypothetical protein [Schleiferilactobacillus harbinensis]MCI1913858.1 hypothetical protein [Schleiferilactobacillus harbinensis]
MMVFWMFVFIVGSVFLVEKNKLPAFIYRLSGFQTIILAIVTIVASVLLTGLWPIKYVVIPAVTIFVSLIIMHKYSRIKMLHPQGRKNQ